MKFEILIPVAKPKLPTFKDLKPLLESIDSTRHYTNGGPLLKQYESELASYFEVEEERVVVLANATLALQGCVQISDRMKWVTQDFTFAASGLAIYQAGKELILSDVCEDSWQLDITKIKKLLDWQNFGIMPVLPFGSPLDLNKWLDFDHVVVDAAASLGAPQISLSNIPPHWKIVFSTHATKVLPSGEGGFVVCGSKEEAGKLRSWSNFGFSAARHSEMIGTNAKMSEYLAAVGLTSFRSRKLEAASWKQVNDFALQIDKTSNFHSIISKLPGYRPYWIQQFEDIKTRNRVEKIFFENGIQTRRWWERPLSKMPAFAKAQSLGSRVSLCLSETTLGLPMYRDLKKSDFKFIHNIMEQI